MRPRPGTPLRACFFGNYGNGNLGDTATLEATVAHFRAAFPSAQLSCLSPNPAGAAQEHGLPAYPMIPGRAEAIPAAASSAPGASPSAAVPPTAAPTGFLGLAFLLRAYRFLKGQDVLVFSGGGQFDESFDGPWGYPFILFKFALLARLAGCRLWILSVGCEVIRTRTGGFFSRACMRWAEYLSYRDKPSQDLAAEIGYRASAREAAGAGAKGRVFPDLAFSLAMAAAAAAPIVIEPGEPGTHGGRAPRGWVGINPLPFKHPQKWPRGDAGAYAGFLAKVSTCLGQLAAQGYGLLFLPSQKRMDVTVVEDLKRETRLRAPGMPPAWMPDLPPLDLAGLLAHMQRVDFLLAMRFHGIVLGAMLGKPVIALSYQRKMSGLMEDLGQADYVLDAADFDAEAFRASFAALEAGAAGVRASMRAKATAYRSRLESQYSELTNLIREER